MQEYDKLTSKEFDKHYDFKVYEPLVEKYWLEYDFYNKSFDAFINDVIEGKIKLEIAKEKVYSIDTPPPTVNADGMHIGHAFSYSQIDFFARFQRMRGKVVYFPFGFDDNGLPTERYVEKKIGKKADEMSREEFRKICYEKITELEKTFQDFWIRMGLSADFRNPYSTISPEVIKISQLSFVELYEQGRIYRKDSPIQWCPECKTAISQTETKDLDLESTFNDIVFKLIDEKGNEVEDLIIATTRPELLPACVAVFIHPSDPRASKYVGKKAKVPLFNFTVPILADERVDPEKGTGIVMCCTFGDVTDVEWYKVYNLPLKEAINEKGIMTEIAGKYRGMKLLEARKAIIEDLKSNNLLINQKKIVHTVNVHERCNTPIELLSRPQWFIKYLDLKDDFLRLGKELKWYPEHMVHRYNNWIKGLQWDWCISRQRYFGVPIPVWYCEKGHIVVAKKEELPVDPTSVAKKCPICGSNCKPDEDVLDTWATSSLTPFIISKWREDDLFFKLTFPNSLRPQAHDIISFWLFNTVVKSWLHEKSLPWKNAAISGYVLAADGSKMSKSKGNVVNPWDIINQYGSDVLRFWAGSSKLGEDLPIEDKEFINGKKFVDKMWNASRFLMMNLDNYYKAHSERKIDIFEVSKASKFFLNRWLLTKLSKATQSATKAFEENYDYSKVKQYAEKFFRQVYCDNYLEFVKYYFKNETNDDLMDEIIATLKLGLLNSLKLISPIMPHISEVLYHKIFTSDLSKTIHFESWPEVVLIDEDAEALGDYFAMIVSAVRKYRALEQKKFTESIKEISVYLEEKYIVPLMNNQQLLKEILNAETINLNVGRFKVIVDGKEITDFEYSPVFFN
ncbi:MAG: valine--tRNA ligase [Candidatus Woesearchaeota archaeon]